MYVVCTMDTFFYIKLLFLVQVVSNSNGYRNARVCKGHVLHQITFIYFLLIWILVAEFSLGITKV